MARHEKPKQSIPTVVKQKKLDLGRRDFLKRGSAVLAHTPSRLVDQHIATGEDFLQKIPKTETVLIPE